MKIALFFLLFFFSITIALPTKKISAAGVSCTANFSPNSISNNTSTNLTITNNGSTDLTQIVIDAPTSNHQLMNSIEGDNWTPYGFSSNHVLLLGGTITPNSSTSLTIKIDSTVASTDNESWKVTAAENSSGGESTDCSGASLSISGTESLGISNLTVSSITETEATINWDSNLSADSTVYYGTTQGYGLTVSDTDKSTSHTLTLTNLTPGTTYHFKIKSSSGSSIVESTNNTLTTGIDTVVGTSTVSTTVVYETITKNVSTKIESFSPDTTAPYIELDTKYQGIYTRFPKIKGIATDDTGIINIEYSIDNGKNWWPAEINGTLGGKKLQFSLNPSQTSDGDYQLLIKATDRNRNFGYSSKFTIVIDKAPPTAGPAVLLLDKTPLVPDQNGNFTILLNMSTKIALFSIGGTTSIEAFDGTKSIGNMQKNTNSGLWTLEVNFDTLGTHKLWLKCRDGAGNTTTKGLFDINIIFPGKLPNFAKIKVFEFDNTNLKFKAVKEISPKSDGTYLLYLTNGKYYLEISALNHQLTRSEIFNITKPIFINQDIQVNKPTHLLDYFFAKSFILNLKENDKPPTNTFINLEFPLSEKLDLRGKPTVVTFLSTWVPQSNQLISSLIALKNTHPEMNYYIISPMESSAKIFTFQKIGQYEINMIADTENRLASQLNLNLLPTTFILDNHGIIKRVHYGVSLNYDDPTFAQ